MTAIMNLIPIKHLCLPLPTTLYPLLLIIVVIYTTTASETSAASTLIPKTITI